MKMFHSRIIRLVVLAAFVGFHAAQTLHTHKARVANDDCAICQVVHHTPGVDAAVNSALHTIFTFQPLLSVGGRIVVADRSFDSSRPRAPPAA